MKVDNTYLSLSKEFYSIIDSTIEYKPELVLFNDELAIDLGLNSNELKSDLDILLGNKGVRFAQSYAGHQYGHLTMLGDGRALMIGEVVNQDRYDIQLKGSGETPYSRRGDGKATLYSMLREYLISEAMYALGVPTTRSLAVLTTGEEVRREETHKGAILARTAKSHIRVGTFEFAASLGEEKVKELADYTINRHYPDSEDYLDFYKKVVVIQARLIAKWMSIGFVHGVMNTDNMLVSGESIDYGPCAFMNEYSTETVFSSIDRHGRYKYGNQPYIGSWNLARLAETLLPLFSKDNEVAVLRANEALKLYEETYSKEYMRLMTEKIGVNEPTLVYELLKLLEEHKLDYTNTFSLLSENSEIVELIEWINKWRQSEIDFELMKAVNPKIIPRNNIVEEALREAAFSNDFKMFNKLLKYLQNPFEEVPVEWTKSGKHVTTYCGT